MTEQNAVLRPGTEKDLNLILSDWLKSYRDSILASQMTNAVYFKGHQDLIKAALQRSTVICAVNPMDTDHVFGWMCIEDPAILHYIYVKHAFRGFKIAKKLLSLVETRPFIFTHHTTSFEPLSEGGTYSIYQFLGA